MPGSSSPTLACIYQGFGPVTFYLADPGHLYADPLKNTIEFKNVKLVIFVINVSDDKILELGSQIFAIEHGNILL